MLDRSRGDGEHAGAGGDASWITCVAAFYIGVRAALKLMSASGIGL